MSRTKTGDAGIEIEGTVHKALNPREGKYGWTQFIVLKDATGEQGCNIGLEEAGDAVVVGENLIVKGTVKDYVNSKGKPAKSLNGGIVDRVKPVNEVAQAKPKTQNVQNNYTNNDYWKDKFQLDKERNVFFKINNGLIVRECALKAVTEMVAGSNPFGIKDKKEFFAFANECVEYIYLSHPGGITDEDITRELGGAIVKRDRLQESIEKAKEAQKESRESPTQKQLDQIYGYINDQGEEINGIVDSKYMDKILLEKIGKAADMTKQKAIQIWDYWYGNEEGLGEREKRQMISEGKNIIDAKHEPLVEKNPETGTSLAKDIFLDTIAELRKKLYLTDDEKFTKELGFNTNFSKWTEKELEKLAKKLKEYLPKWVTEKSK